MKSSAETQLSKWWLHGVAFLLSTPSALIVWFEDRLTPYLGSVAPLVVLRAFALLFLTIGVLFILLIYQHPWLKWDESTGTWINRFNELRYCGACRANKMTVPLKNESSGWSCVSCGKFHMDPTKQNQSPQRTYIATARMRT